MGIGDYDLHLHEDGTVGSSGSTLPPRTKVAALSHSFIALALPGRNYSSGGHSIYAPAEFRVYAILKRPPVKQDRPVAESRWGRYEVRQILSFDKRAGAR